MMIKNAMLVFLWFTVTLSITLIIDLLPTFFTNKLAHEYIVEFLDYILEQLNRERTMALFGRKKKMVESSNFEDIIQPGLRQLFRYRQFAEETEAAAGIWGGGVSDSVTTTTTETPPAEAPMLPKDLLNDLEKGDRTMEFLKPVYDDNFYQVANLMGLALANQHAHILQQQAALSGLGFIGNGLAQQQQMQGRQQ